MRFKTFLYFLSAFSCAAVSVALTGDIIDPADIISAAAPMAILTDPMRAKYLRLLRKLEEKYGIDIKDDTPIITETSLRLEEELTAGDNIFEFDIKRSEGGGDRDTERKITTNQLFFLTHLKLGISKQDKGENPNGDTNNVVFTFPDANFFTGTNEADHLETLYQGWLTMNTSSLERLDGIYTDVLRKVPETQTEDIDTDTPPTQSTPNFGPTLEQHGYHPVNPENVLDGRRTNKFRLEIGKGDRGSIAGADVNNRNFVVLQPYGFLVSSLNLGNTKGQKAVRT